MSLKNITIVIEPTRKSLHQESTDETTRQFDEYDRFAEELQKYTQVSVTIIEDFLSAAPDEGFILLYAYDLTKSLNGCRPEMRQTLQKRLVLMNTFEDEIFNLLNEYNFAAAITHLIYRFWQIKEIPPDLRGLHGLTSVAKKICTDFFFENGHYCIMKDTPFNSLPALLIRYLEAYLKIVMNISDVPSLEDLLSVLEREDQDIRREAVLKLSSIPDTRVVETLLSLLDDDDWMVRARVARGLTCYAQAFGLDFDLSPILGQVITQDSRSEVRSMAARWLMEYANRFGLDIRAILHQAITQDPDRRVKGMALTYLYQHIKALGLDVNPDLRQVIREARDKDVRELAKAWLDDTETHPPSTSRFDKTNKKLN